MTGISCIDDNDPHFDQQRNAHSCLKEILERLDQDLLSGQATFYSLTRKDSKNQSMVHKTTRPLRSCSTRFLQKCAIFYRTCLTVFRALEENKRIQKRDLFYRDIRLYQSQTRSNACVMRLSKLFNVPREALNVVAAVKGICYGGWVRVYLRQGGIIDILANGTRHALPHAQDIAYLDGNIEFVVIVEKEAVFGMIVDGWTKIYEGVGRRPFIVVTAKGYPDRATLLFLGLLRMQRPGMRFFALVDWDPFGMDIFMKFRFGLRDVYSEIPDLELLGVKSSDVLDCPNKVKLSDRDHARLYGILKTTSSDNPIRRELVAMHDMDCKMEIDVLVEKSPAGVTQFTTEYLIHALTFAIHNPR